MKFISQIKVTVFYCVIYLYERNLKGNNMKNILAENLLRFGVRNLSESDITNISNIILNEQVLITTPENLRLNSQQITEFEADEYMKAGYAYTLKVFQQNNVIFSVTQDDAAKVVAYHTMSTKRDSIEPITFSKRTLSLPKSTSGNVKTYGVFSPTGAPVNTLTTISESTYNNIVLYLNNLMLLQLMKPDESVKTTAGIKISLINPGKQGTVLSIPKSFETRQTEGLHCYGTMRTTITKEPANTNPTILTVPTTKPELVKKFDESLFVTNKITLANTSELDEMISELNTILQSNQNYKIKSIIIESSASGDRSVGGKSGYPNDQADLKKYPIGTPYRPKTATESGNAALAYGRGNTIKTYLESNNIGVVPTIDALIQTGGDQAQYAKVFIVLVDMSTGGKEISAPALKSIVTKVTQTNLQDTLQIAYLYRKPN
jgi:outer membrane protein OmpA-like peptidoglycan-associated protein